MIAAVETLRHRAHSWCRPPELILANAAKCLFGRFLLFVSGTAIASLVVGVKILSADISVG